MKFSNFTKLLAIVFLMISFFSTKTLANYEKVFFDFSVELVNGKLIDLKEYKNKKVCMIFQPHRFSRTAQLFDDFIKVLKQTDSLIMLDIYSASEKPIKGINSRRIVETLKQNGHKDVTYLKKHDDVIDLIKKKKDDFDILVTQGAGSVSNICQIIKNQWET